MLLLVFKTDFAKVAFATDDALTGTALTYLDIPGLTPLPWWQTAAIFCYAMAACLGLNDAAKVAMIRWRVPASAA
jgi:hypothetical protein